MEITPAKAYSLNKMRNMLHSRSKHYRLTSLEEVQELYNDGTSDQKKKADTAKDILKNIYNVKFALSLAVLCDVYTIYSQIAVLLQVLMLV